MGWEEFCEKKDKFDRIITMGFRGGIKGTERWREDNARGRVWARRSKEEEPEAFGTISSFLNCLFALLILKSYFAQRLFSALDNGEKS